MLPWLRSDRQGSSEEADGHRMGQFTLSMHVVNPLRSDSLIGIAMPRSAPGSGRDPERETPSSLEPRRSLSVVAGARNHLYRTAVRWPLGSAVHSVSQ